MILQIGEAVILFLVGGIAIHMVTMFLDYYLVTEPLSMNLRENFVDSIFSVPMIPMIGTYGLFLLVVHFFWKMKKKALLVTHEKEIQIEKVEIVLKSMQRLTGILAEHIATQNGEIMHWVESRKLKGQSVPKKVEKPTKKIAGALQSLSKIAFVFPYTENPPQNVGEIEKVLQCKLDQLKRNCTKQIKSI